jgi:sugar/nucleoside kinase (ribokinase family)
VSKAVFVAGPVAWNHHVHLDRMPGPGPSTVTALGDETLLGGTSAGKALNLRALGVPVVLRTVVGDDGPGAKVTEQLSASGADLILERASRGGTERHLNLMDRAGGRISLHLERPVLDEQDVRFGDESRDALCHAAAAVIDLSDHSRPLLGQATETGCSVWCDLHDYDGASPWHEDFRRAADYLFMNDDALPDPVPLMERCLDDRARLVVVTRGARGALAMAEDRRLRVVPASPIASLVDSNGAGDAFLAGFLARQFAGGDLDDCLSAAADHAARCVQVTGLAP